MMRYPLFAALALLLSVTVPAQNCEEVIDKQTQKAIDKATGPKTDLKTRFDLMRTAVENNEDCLKCKMILAQLSYGRAEQNPNVSFNGAKRIFEDIIAQCPTYHADAYYYLGVIEYGMNEWSASQSAFEGFLAFDTSDPERISRDHQQRMMDVEEIISEVRSKAELFDNPIDFAPVKVEGVSARSDEYLPMLSPDNQLMFFTRRYTKDGRSVLDKVEVEEFTLSRRNGLSAPFDGGKALPPPFNRGDNYGGATLSVDNKEMFVTACRPGKQGYNNCDLYRTTYSKTTLPDGKEDYVWTELENLGPNVNTDDGWESQPSLSADGNTLYFATARANTTPNESGDPSIDIYYSERGADGRWSQAKSIGARINTPANEKSPFMHGDSRTLYFSSNGLTGVGGYDIFFAKLQDNGRWGEPKNVGVPINTPEDEHGLIVATDGSKAYYASSKIQGAQGFDIYAFEVPERAKPEKVLLVKGTVTDEAGEVVEDATIELNFLESKKVQRIDIDQDDGSYATIVNVEREPVVMTIESAEHAFKAQLLDEAKAEEGLVSEVDLKLEEVSIGTPYAIDDINYATNSAEIGEGSKAVLQTFAAYLKKNSAMKIAIHGHTDNVGGAEENKTLSTERAFEVMKFLQESGVAASAMTFKGFGQSSPIASNESEEGRAANRRTEFVITSK